MPAVAVCLSALVVALTALASGCAGRDEQLVAKGNLQLRRGDLAGALESYREAVSVAPRSAAAHARLGAALFEAQRYQDSERAYRTAAQLDPELGEPWRALALIALRRGRTGEAEALLYQTATRRPADADAQVMLATARWARADLPTADAAFDHVLARRPGHVAALYGRGRLALRKGNYDRAEASFARVESLAPKRPYGAYGRALVAARRGQTQEACVALARAVALGLADRRGVALDREGHPLRKAACYQAALAGRAPMGGDRP